MTEENVFGWKNESSDGLHVPSKSSLSPRLTTSKSLSMHTVPHQGPNFNVSSCSFVIIFEYQFGFAIPSWEPIHSAAQ